MVICDLVIEVTRRCNLECYHCLRGKAQNLNIPLDLIPKFLKFNDITSIGSLTLTGGEPMLNVKAMNNIIKYIHNENIYVAMFYMATNGSQWSNEFLSSLGILFEIVNDKEQFQIKISRDQYHYTDIDRRWNMLQGSIVTFDEHNYSNVIAEGYGIDINPEGRKPYDEEWIWGEENPLELDEGMVYINAKGNILKGCDYSYATQNKKHFGHCLSKHLNEI